MGGKLHNFQVWKHRRLMEHVVIRDERRERHPEPGWRLLKQVFAPNFLDAHQQVLGRLPPIDEPIKPLVLLLNELGYLTQFSCSGHRPSDRGCIAMIAPDELHLRRLCEALRRSPYQRWRESVEVDIEHWLDRPDLLKPGEWPICLRIAVKKGPPSERDYGWLTQLLRETLAAWTAPAFSLPALSSGLSSWFQREDWARQGKRWWLMVWRDKKALPLPKQ